MKHRIVIGVLLGGLSLRLFQRYFTSWKPGWFWGITDFDVVGSLGALFLLLYGARKPGWIRLSIGLTFIALSPWYVKQISPDFWIQYFHLILEPIVSFLTQGSLNIYYEKEAILFFTPRLSMSIHSGSSGLDLFLLAFGFLCLGQQKALPTIAMAFVLAFTKIPIYFGICELVCEIFGPSYGQLLLWHLLHKHAFWILAFICYFFLRKKPASQQSRFRRRNVVYIMDLRT